MLNFLPLEEEDLLNLLPDGTYDFLVKESVKHRAPSGNLSIKLTLGIYDNKGAERIIFCYLSQNYMLLLKHFCDSVGLDSAYQSGALSPEICVNRSGKCKVITEHPEEGSTYQPKNVVKDFIKADNKINMVVTKDDFVDSELPF